MAQRSRQTTPPAPSGDRGKPYPVKFKLRNRFYEVLVLYQCLHRVHAENGSTGPPSFESAPSTNQEDKWLFRSFVNKLGQLCDSSKGGNTVTAFAVLNQPAGVQYVFGSNHRAEPALQQVRTYIEEILRDVGRCSPAELRRKDVSSGILRKVLIFVRDRAGDYARIIHQAADPCIEACRAEGGDAEELQQTCDELARLRDSAASARKKEMDGDLFSQVCEKLILDIEAIHDGPLEGFAKRPRHVNSCWGDVRHATGRLLSYLYGIKILIASRDRWPQLFQEFEVTAVPSFPRLPNPLMGGTRKDHSAAAIVGRMTSEGSRIEEYRQKVEELQVFSLDEMIREEAEAESFKPVVHAELIVHDWLIRGGHTHVSNFFQDIKYIGSSKPTCKLCQYYFDVHPLGFQVRPSHGNLYLKWRAPDVFPDQGDKGIKERENIMNKMLEPLRKDVFRVVKEKLFEGSRYDSNTEPTKNIYQVIQTLSAAVHEERQLAVISLDIEQQLQRLRLSHGRDEELDMEPDEGAEDGADDELDGGVRL